MPIHVTAILYELLDKQGFIATLTPARLGSGRAPLGTLVIYDFFKIGGLFDLHRIFRIGAFGHQGTPSQDKKLYKQKCIPVDIRQGQGASRACGRWFDDNAEKSIQQAAWL